MSSPSLPTSLALYEAARDVIPGGVTSSIRAGALPHPLYVERGDGAYLWDADGRRYVDFVLGYGPLILGHAPEVIREALAAQASRGTTFGSQHRGEIELAQRLTQIIPGAERVLLTTTGSEAVAVALRLARAATERRCILKFEGHYHGWLDGAFASTGYWPDRSGPADAPTLVPGTDGVSPGALQDVLVAPWNDLDATRRIVEAHAPDVAAIILEPLLVNGGLIAPEPGFLDGLRELTRRVGCLLIFDEVITGLRLGLGGAQALFGVTADLAIFAKALAGGVPIAAVTGRASVLDLVASGRVLHNGTFNGNGLGTAAALATIQRLSSDPASYPTLFDLGNRLAAGLASSSPRLRVRHLGPVVHTSVDEPGDVRSIRDRASGKPEVHARFIEALLVRGIHATPRGLWYLSLAHSPADVDLAIEAAHEAVADVLG